MAELNNDRKFVGVTKKLANNFYGIGLTQEHIDMLQANINDRGWVNINLSEKKDGSGAYCFLQEAKPSDNVVTSKQDGDLPF